MAPVIDASTPAAVAITTVTASSATTAAFTPPLGAKLVCFFGDAWNASPMVKPVNTGGAVTWDTSAAASVVSTYACGIWVGTVTTSASMTVKETIATTDNTWMFAIAVITGADAGFASPYNTATANATAAPSVGPLTLRSSNSLVCAIFMDGSTGDTPTAGTNQSLTWNAHVFQEVDTTDGGANWAQYDTRTTLASGTNVTLNDTAPGSIVYRAAMLEIDGGAAAAAVVPFIPDRMPLGV